MLALEEPTRGVDISSKAEIYEILRAFAADGGAVLLFCTEIPEVFEVADRLHVVSDGRLSRPLDVAQFADMEALAKSGREPRDARLGRTRRMTAARLQRPARGRDRRRGRDRPGGRRAPAERGAEVVRVRRLAVESDGVAADLATTEGRAALVEATRASATTS